MMSLHEATAKIKVGSSYLNKFPTRVCVPQGSVLSLLLFTTVTEVIRIS